MTSNELFGRNIYKGISSEKVYTGGTGDSIVKTRHHVFKYKRHISVIFFYNTSFRLHLNKEVVKKKGIENR